VFYAYVDLPGELVRQCNYSREKVLDQKYLATAHSEQARDLTVRTIVENLFHMIYMSCYLHGSS